MEKENTPITIAYGDGIGSEIMESALTILREAGASIKIETIEIGQRIYNMGARHGILPSAWDTLSRNKVLLKSPIIIPAPMIPGMPDYEDINKIIYKKFNLSTENQSIYTIIDIPDSEWLSASATIGEDFALFETTHDSAPEIAGKNIANPSAIIQASIMLLRHINQPDTALLIENALKRIIKDGIHTADIYNRKTSKKKVGLDEFTEELIARL
ncbi:MAG: isocitrate/isopropylmalate family dehydrogenase [Pseudomonadota bacterium]|mgnify:CR=1 FL=1